MSSFLFFDTFKFQLPSTHTHTYSCSHTHKQTHTNVNDTTDCVSTAVSIKTHMKQSLNMFNGLHIFDTRIPGNIFLQRKKKRNDINF